jgi:hypothetical protein
MNNKPSSIEYSRVEYISSISNSNTIAKQLESKYLNRSKNTRMKQSTIYLSSTYVDILKRKQHTNVLRLNDINSPIFINPLAIHLYNVAKPFFLFYFLLAFGYILLTYCYAISKRPCYHRTHIDKSINA